MKLIALGFVILAIIGLLGASYYGKLPGQNVGTNSGVQLNAGSDNASVKEEAQIKESGSVAKIVLSSTTARISKLQDEEGYFTPVQYLTSTFYMEGDRSQARRIANEDLFLKEFKSLVDKSVDSTQDNYIWKGIQIWLSENVVLTYNEENNGLDRILVPTKDADGNIKFYLIDSDTVNLVKDDGKDWDKLTSPDTVVEETVVVKKTTSNEQAAAATDAGQQNKVVEPVVATNPLYKSVT